MAPAASVYAVKVLDSHGVGDDFTVAEAMAQLPADIDIINLSLGGYTDRDQPPLAIATAHAVAWPQRPRVVAAAGNHAEKRPFWPAAFGPVLAVGAVEDKRGKWAPASYSNYGPWVDAVARGSQPAVDVRAREDEGRPGPVDRARHDPIVAFDGWAEWDGTSFSTPIAAAMIARTMSRTGLYHAPDAAYKLTLNSPGAALAEFPNAKLVDELR